MISLNLGCEKTAFCLLMIGNLLPVHLHQQLWTWSCKSSLNLIAVRSASSVKKLECSTWFHMRRIRCALGFTLLLNVPEFCKFKMMIHLKLATEFYLPALLGWNLFCHKQRHRKQGSKFGSLFVLGWWVKHSHRVFRKADHKTLDWVGGTKSLSDKLSLYLSFPFLENSKSHRNAFMTCVKEDSCTPKGNVITKGIEKYWKSSETEVWEIFIQLYLAEGKLW